MIEEEKTKPGEPGLEILEETTTTTGLLSRVVLFNDDWHTFDEVIVQLIKAIHCSFEKARAHAFEVHIKGKSIVYKGEMKECLRVSSILEEILLKTEIIT
ncbi:MAG TPA: ATP-dependent Clp protease adaptor ClpS [Ignavibacteriaceae bacterium]|nr:ATP-dependent Clp protease adaptor ClpS [Ignavibacteriaceae bacterium]